MSKLSVIICTFNRADQLGETLERFYEQVLPADCVFELIVVDNNSNDHTKNVVMEWIKKVPFELRYCFEGRQGKSFAMNCGIANASGDLLAFTDDDVLVARDWVFQLCEAFRDQGVGGVGGKILPKWEVNTFPSWFSKDLHPNLALLDYGDQSFDLDRDHPFYGANMSFRKEVFQKIGLFRVDLGRSGNILLGNEDTEMFKRAFDAGFKMLYDPKICVHHVIPEERMKKDYFRRYHFRSGQSIVISGRDTKAGCRSFLGIPLWRLKDYLKSIPKWLLNTLSLRSAEAFVAELHLCEFAGYVYGLLRMKTKAAQTLNYGKA